MGAGEGSPMPSGRYEGSLGWGMRWEMLSTLLISERKEDRNGTWLMGAGIRVSNLESWA